jgi:hypothetical protein
LRLKLLCAGGEKERWTTYGAGSGTRHGEVVLDECEDFPDRHNGECVEHLSTPRPIPKISFQKRREQILRIGVGEMEI